MNKAIVEALIIGAAILIAAGMLIYFSPYNSCVRANLGGSSDATIARQCVRS